MVKKILCCLLLLIINFNLVKAECSSEKIATMKYKVQNISVEYVHNNELYNEFGGKIVNVFDLNINNFDKDLSIWVDDGYETYLLPTEDSSIITINDFYGGTTVKLKVVSNECETVTREIMVTLPYYNTFFNSEECKKYPDANVCKEFLNSKIDNETFYAKIEEYEKKIQNNNKEEIEDNGLNVILRFLSDNYMYIVIVLCIILITSFIFFINKKRKELK